MDVERVRAIVKKLAHVEETVQWGENLVFWVGDKAIGGKMFALVNMDPGGVVNAAGRAVMSFSAGQERYVELVENEGVVPAPYFARIHWVALEHWEAIEPRELAALLAAAHALTYAKLPQRTKDVLALPAGERRKLIEEERQKLATAKVAEDARKESTAELQRAARKAARPAKKKSSRAARTSLR
jgi:predicted DNA-binding protein (MmcQ/YjbR family)